MPAAKFVWCDPVFLNKALGEIGGAAETNAKCNFRNCGSILTHHVMGAFKTVGSDQAIWYLAG